MKKIMIGILGASRGKEIVEAARLCKSVEINSICNRHKELADKIRNETGIENIFHDYKRMLETDIDAVFIATPIPLHVDNCIEALSAGKHVISEVTAATSIEDCHRLLNAVKSSGKKYMMAENYCYIRSWSIIANMVKEGLFGEVYYGEADFLMDFKARPDMTDFPNIEKWRKDTYLMHRGHTYITHSLGPLCQVFEEPIETVACVGSGIYHDFDLKQENTCTVLCKTGKEKLIRLRLDFLSSRPNNFTYNGIQGTRGCYEGARYPGDFNKVYIEGICEKGTWKNLDEFVKFLPDVWKTIPSDVVDEGYDGGTFIMLEEFAQSIINDEEPPIDIYKALNWTAAGLMSEVSIENNGAVVDVEDF